MILPPRIDGVRRRRPVGLYPDRPDWHSFALGACALIAIAAFCLFVAAHLGS